MWEGLGSHLAANRVMQRYYFRTTGTEAGSKCAFSKPNKKELRLKKNIPAVFSGTQSEQVSPSVAED